MKKWIPNPVKDLLKSWLGKVTPAKIHIDRDVFIAKSAVVETRGGGSITISSGTEVLDGVMLLTYGGHITIGRRCSINPYTIIYGHGNTTIGNDVLIAGHCMIIPNQHNFSVKEKSIRDQGSTRKGIIIEDDVWIAHACTILDGVRIGRGSVIGAGSVVTQDVEPYSVMGGVPAKLIRQRS